MAQRAGVLLGGPFATWSGGGQLARVDVDHRGIGRAQLLAVRRRLGIDLFGQREALAAGFGQADQFLQPGGAGGLEVQAGAGALERPADGA